MVRGTRKCRISFWEWINTCSQQVQKASHSTPWTRMSCDSAVSQTLCNIWYRKCKCHEMTVSVCQRPGTKGRTKEPLSENKHSYEKLTVGRLPRSTFDRDDMLLLRYPFSWDVLSSPYFFVVRITFLCDHNSSINCLICSVCPAACVQSHILHLQSGMKKCAKKKDQNTEKQSRLEHGNINTSHDNVNQSRNQKFVHVWIVSKITNDVYKISNIRAHTSKHVGKSRKFTLLRSEKTNDPGQNSCRAWQSALFGNHRFCSQSSRCKTSKYWNPPSKKERALFAQSARLMIALYLIWRDTNGTTKWIAPTIKNSAKSMCTSASSYNLWVACMYISRAFG